LGCERRCGIFGKETFGGPWLREEEVIVGAIKSRHKKLLLWL
jgi:hypothetical protein